MVLLKNLKIQNKLFLGFAATLSIFASLAVYVSTSTSLIAGSARGIELYNYPRLELISQMIRSTALMDAHEAAISIGKKESGPGRGLLRTYADKFEISLGEYSLLIKGNEAEEAAVLPLRNAFDRYKAGTENLDRHAPGRRTALMEIRAQAEDIYNGIMGELSADLGRISALAAREFQVYCLLLLGAILVGIGISLYLARSLTGPIRKLLEQQTAFKNGLPVYPQPENRADEIGELQSGFSDMVGELTRTLVSKEKLEQALNDTKSILEQLPIGVVIVGGDRKIRSINKSTLKLTGHASDKELVGMVCHKLVCPAEEGECPVLDLGQTVCGNSERTLLRKDGVGIPVLKTVLPITLNGKKVLLELFMDLTEHKESETERDELKNRLFQSEKMSAVGQLAAGVAHEINNPLGIILGFAQGAVKRLKSADDPLALPLKTIEREAVRCKDLVQNLLVFSRSSSAEQRGIIDLNAAMESALSLILARTKTANVELIRDLGAGLPGVSANQTQLQQVVINLAGNAIDAMPGGGKLRVKTALSAKKPEHVEIRISDTGSGIPKALQTKIFEPFFTTKEAGKGTGLGLSLVYEIVAKHGGAIELASEDGKGAEFTVFLPVRPAATPAEKIS